MKAKRIILAITSALVCLGGTSNLSAQTSGCDRGCLSGMVDALLASMVAHRPETLPLTPVYTATENDHPAALGMMTAWRAITSAGKPSLIAIDAPAGQAYFALNVSESGATSVLFGRLKVADRKISEIELYINRSRGDHGFSFSPEQLPANYRKLMTPPPGRVKAPRAELVKLAGAAFDASDPLQVKIADGCQFTELGWQVVDPGLDDVPPPATPAGMKPRDPNEPLGCLFPPFRPTDRKARIVAIDEELGFVVVAGMVPGHVYPYPVGGRMLSAFIPDDMSQAGGEQAAWMDRHVKKGGAPIVSPAPATGETMQVFQYYDGKMQASQINVFLGGAGMQSVWVKR